jgi:hypothetical protein
MRAAIDLPRPGRIVPCVDAREAIAAGVDARDRAALLAVRRKHQRTLHLKHRNGEHIHRRRDHD